MSRFIKIKLNEHNNRLLLIASIELFLQSYEHMIDSNVFVFHDPLTDNIIKVRHVNHAKDNETNHLIYDYRQLRKIILNNTEWSFSQRHAVQLSVVIENYLRNFGGYLDKKDLKQLQNLNRKLDFINE